jgi:pyruvate/2-oxoglutarate dehydrogenase complex dihydrolipoamide dehydrogenase (E3) component
LGSHVLLAVGRTPNTHDLNLAAAGVKANESGYIEVDDELRTSAPGIYAIGDCNGRGAFTHTSYNDFEIVADNLLQGAKRRVSDRIPASALYIDPPLAHIGLSESEVRKQGKRVLVGMRPMTRIARAIEKGETYGFIKIFVDADTQQILGATVFGVGGDEAIHCILTAMYAKQPASLLTHSVHIHPTVAELIPTTLEDLKPLE